jgi:hypothetical protein
VVRLTRGRLWIGTLGALLVGIVALNVLALSFSASTSRIARQADVLKRENSALRAGIADDLANEQIQRTAARLGLVVPDPGAITYLGLGGDDAGAAARRLLAGDFTVAAATSAPAVTTTTTAPVPTETETAPPPEEVAAEPEPAAAAPTTGAESTSSAHSTGTSDSGGGLTAP